MLCFFSCSQKKKTNWRISFDKKSKEPYGCYLAYNMLPYIYPNATITSGKNAEKKLSDIVNQVSTEYGEHNLIIIVTQNFDIENAMLDKIQSYLAMNNYLIILSTNFSQNVLDYYHVNATENQFINLYDNIEDTSTCNIRFNKTYTPYSFHGENINGFFEKDTSYHDTLNIVGYTSSIKNPNVLLSTNLIIGLNPLCFTNYFLLQNNNKEYYEKLLSYFPENINSVTWYSSKNYSEEKSDSDIGKLFSITPIRYSFLIILGLLLIYTLFESKRRQKIIPTVIPNANSSLEFAETIGMLYYNKKDNINLFNKMIQYYLEHLRTKYNLKTNELNEHFSQQLAYKISKTETETNAFISYINYLRVSTTITDKDIQHLYHQLKKFS